MRDRLVAALVGMTVAVIALYAVPRAYFIADLVHRQETRKIERSADLLALLVAERTADRAAVTDDYLAQLLNEAEGIRYVGPDGTVARAGVDPGERGAIVETRPVDGGGSVTLARSGDLVDQRVSEALMPLVVIGIGLTVFAALAGFWLARRLAAPFRELADAATTLGSGNLEAVHISHYTVPEAEDIGAALRSSADQLSTLLRREREFAVNASHQLRTPITALRLELEDLTHWPETHPAVAAELELSLAELDRLSEAITEFLGMARGTRHAEKRDLDLAALVAEVGERWAPRLAERGRDVVVSAPVPVPARVVPGSVMQVLDVLIENACEHGAGDVTLTAGEDERYVVVSVGDEGPLAFGREVFRRGESGDGGTGVGLALATEIAQALDGRLDLGPGPHTSFVLRMPRNL